MPWRIPPFISVEKCQKYVLLLCSELLSGFASCWRIVAGHFLCLSQLRAKCAPSQGKSFDVRAALEITSAILFAQVSSTQFAEVLCEAIPACHASQSTDASFATFPPVSTSFCVLHACLTLFCEDACERARLHRPLSTRKGRPQRQSLRHGRAPGAGPARDIDVTRFCLDSWINVGPGSINPSHSCGVFPPKVMNPH